MWLVWLVTHQLKIPLRLQHPLLTLSVFGANSSTSAGFFCSVFVW